MYKLALVGLIAATFAAAPALACDPPASSEVVTVEKKKAEVVAEAPAAEATTPASTEATAVEAVEAAATPTYSSCSHDKKKKATPDNS